MFEDISIGIKTFLRDSHLEKAIQSIQQNMSYADMIIADDGDMTNEKFAAYADLGRKGHTIISLPFDSGFGAKSNTIIDHLRRPYLLVGCDDFDFTKEAASGVSSMKEILDFCPDVDVVCGRVNNNPYEFDLEDRGDAVIEQPVEVPINPRPWFLQIDLAANYCLVRKRVFEKVRWDEDVKIGGGEHATWYIDLRRAGFRVVYCLKANINEIPIRNSSRYNSYRNRVSNPARPCFERRGIRVYLLGNGNVDYGGKQ